MPLQSALQPLVEVVVGLAATCGVESEAANIDAMPCEARRARPRRCEVHRSACRCKIVLWSCLRSAMNMCVGVCIVGAHARVLARACVRVPRRCCRTSPATPETALALSSSTTAGRRREQRWHPWRNKLHNLQLTGLLTKSKRVDTEGGERLYHGIGCLAFFCKNTASQLPNISAIRSTITQPSPAPLWAPLSPTSPLGRLTSIGCEPPRQAGQLFSQGSGPAIRSRSCTSRSAAEPPS